MTEPTATPRIGARVLLIDPDGRILLIHEKLRRGTHWLTPGGGVEADESLPLAASRELYEETGLQFAIDDSDEAAHVAQRMWSWTRGRGEDAEEVFVDQTDHYFVVALDHQPAVAPAAPTEAEQRSLIEMRWWSVEDLRAADDANVVPPDLADVLSAVLTHLPPRRAIT